MAKYNNRLQVSVSDRLLGHLKDRADYTGASIPEYVRYVLTKEIEKEADCYMVDESAEKIIEKGLQDYKAGHSKKFSDAKDAIDYLNKYVGADE